MVQGCLFLHRCRKEAEHENPGEAMECVDVSLAEPRMCEVSGVSCTSAVKHDQFHGAGSDVLPAISRQELRASQKNDPDIRRVLYHKFRSTKPRQAV